MEIVRAIDQLDGNIREELINVAINFLLNPKIKSSPLFQKRQFLAEKGLTRDEIDVAIDRFLVYVSNESSLPFNQNSVNYRQSFPPLYSHAHPPPVTAAALVPSFWLLTRAITPPAILVGSALYGLYWLYVNYIHPLLYGRIPSSTEILKEEIRRISDQLGKLQLDITRIEYSIKSNFDHELAMASSTGAGAAEIAAIGELKSEIASIKAMILSQDRFPSTPSSSLSIPSWQLPSTTNTTTTAAIAASPVIKDDNKSLPFSTKLSSESRKPAQTPSSSPEVNSDSTSKSDSTFEIIPAAHSNNGGQTKSQPGQGEDLKERSDSTSESNGSPLPPDVVSTVDQLQQQQQQQQQENKSSQPTTFGASTQPKHQNKHRNSKKSK